MDLAPPEGSDWRLTLATMARRPLVSDAEQYGDKFQEHFLEQYKLFVSTSLALTERRMATNNYLMTVNAFLVSLFGLGAYYTDFRAFLIILPLTGAFTCVAWWALITSFKNLNRVKFKVIHDLEQHLPCAPFDHEWLLADRGLKKTYRPLTKVEVAIPVLFFILWLGLGVFGGIKGKSYSEAQKSRHQLDSQAAGQQENPDKQLELPKP